MINRKTLPLTLAVVVLGCLILIFAWGIIRKIQLDRSSEALAVETVETILGSPEASAFLDRMSDSYLERRPRESLLREIDAIRKTMGSFVSIDALAGASEASLLPFFQASPSAAYAMDLTMDEGRARLHIELEYNTGEWQFSNLSMTADRLMN